MQTISPSHSVAALAAGRADAGDGGGDRKHEQRALHGTLLNRNAETAPSSEQQEGAAAAKRP